MNKSLILKNVKIVDTFSGDVLPPLDILVSDLFVQEISENINTDDKCIQELECRDKLVIPGLFECHTHLSALRNQPNEVQKEIFNECEMEGSFCVGELDRLVLSDFLRFGVTQIRDLGGPVQILRDLKEKLLRNPSAGPDIFYAGPMLEMPPLRAQQMNERWPGWTVAVKSSQDVQNIVESLLEDGATCVKVFGKFEDKVLESLVYHAGRSGLPVTCDPGPTFFHDISVNKGLGLGIRCFEHAKSLWYPALKDELKMEHDELKGESPELQNTFTQRLMNMGTESISISKLGELADMMVESQTLLCPTLNIFRFFSEKPEVFNDEEPEKFGPIFAVLFEVGRQIVVELAKHGVRMLIGADSYIPRFTHNEMELLSQNGVKAIEILRGSTLYPAIWLGVDDTYGSVDVGKKANLVILDDNPIDDIKNIRSIFTVIRNGEIVSGPN